MFHIQLFVDAPFPTEAVLGLPLPRRSTRRGCLLRSQAGVASGLAWPLGMGSACCIQRPQGHCQARLLWGLQLLTTP